MSNTSKKVSEVKVKKSNTNHSILEAESRMIGYLKELTVTICDLIKYLKNKDREDKWDFIKDKAIITRRFLIYICYFFHYSTCPFCLERGISLEDCSSCEYAALHGKCIDESGTFKLLTTAINLVDKCLLLYGSNTKEEVEYFLNKVDVEVKDISSRLRKIKSPVTGDEKETS